MPTIATSRPAAEALEGRTLLAATIYDESSYVGNSFGGDYDAGWVQHNVKDAHVTPDGKVIGVTWYEEGHAELAWYQNGGVKIQQGKSLHGNGSDVIRVTADANFVYAVGSGEVYKFKLSDLTYVSTLSITGASSRLLGADVGGGTLYVGDVTNDKIWKIDTATFTVTGSIAFDNPRHVAVAPDGNLWVIRQGTGTVFSIVHNPGDNATVHRIDPSTGAALGQTITDLAMPTELSFDKQGRLAVADSEASRNHIRFYDGTTGAFIETWGRSINSNANGDVVGELKPGKFDFIVGFGEGVDGTYYTVWNGGPEDATSSNAGADRTPGNAQGVSVDAIDPADMTKYNWRRYSSHYINNAMPDPDDETIVYTKNGKFQMDYGKPAGQEATWIGWTLDRQRNPNDYRINQNHNFLAQVYRQSGKLFLVMGDQYESQWFVYRMDGNTAVQCAAWFNGGTWDAESPVALRGLRRIWVDGQGGAPVDGRPQESEFSAAPDNGFAASFRIDHNGGIVAAAAGKVIQIAAPSLSAAGVPQFAVASASKILPPSWNKLNRADYDARTDTMYIGGSYGTAALPADAVAMGPSIVRYDNWSTTRTVRSVMNAPNSSSEWTFGFAFAKDLVFAGVRQGNKVNVFDSMTGGAPLKVFAPADLAGAPRFAGGGFDINLPLNAFERPNGQVLLFAEDVSYAKVYMWYVTAGRPLQPAGVTANAGTGRVNVGWGGNRFGVETYEVYRATSPTGFGTLPYRVGLTQPAFTDASVADGTTYYYKVVALNKNGASDVSAVTSATPQAGVTPLAVTITGPADGTVYGATTVGSITVNASVSGLPTGVTVSRVVFDLRRDGYLSTVTDSAAAYSALYRNVTTGAYTISARVFTSDGRVAEDRSTFVVGGAIPSVPTGLRAVGRTGGVDLVWNYKNGGRSYNVLRGTLADGSDAVSIATGLAEPVYTDATAAVGATYHYFVTATNPAGTSANSAGASATIPGYNGPSLPTSGTYDESTTDQDAATAGVQNNAVDVSATVDGTAGQVGLTTFKANVAAAAPGNAGVVHFDGGGSLDSTGPAIVAAYGPGKWLRMNLSAGTALGQSIFAPISGSPGATNSLIAPASGDVTFTMANIIGGAAGEAVRSFGFTLLTQNVLSSLVYTVTATFSGGGTSPVTRTINRSTTGPTVDTFFGFAAPAAESIVSVSLVSSTSRSGTTRIDDVAFITGTGGTPAAAPPAPATLLSDDFNDGNATGWTTSGTGTWPVTGGLYGTTAGSTAVVSTAGSTSWSNYTVSARVNLSSLNGSASVLGRVRDNASFYMFVLSGNGAGGAHLRLLKSVNGANTQLGEATPVSYATGTWMTLKLSFSGTAITTAYSTNGGASYASAVSLTDSTFATGMIGLRAWNASDLFDDVLVA